MDTWASITYRRDRMVFKKRKADIFAPRDNDVASPTTATWSVVAQSVGASRHSRADINRNRDAMEKGYGEDE
jgi:hypothetical protein